MSDIHSVAVIGVGTMGSAMGRHLEEGGYDFYAYDVDVEKATEAVGSFATVVESAAKAASRADMTIVAVGTYEQVVATICDNDGILAGADPGHVVAISSTLSPEQCVSLGELLAEEGLDPLGAPTCRGEKAAERGDLLVFVGAETSTAERARPVFEQFGAPENVVHLGPIGAGQAAKAANNSLLWSSVVANQEVLLLADAYDIDLDHLRELLAKSTGSNWALTGWDWMHTKWAHKDMHIVTEMARERDVRVPFLALAGQLILDLDQDELDRTR